MTLLLTLLVLAVVAAVVAVATGRITGGLDDPVSSLPARLLPDGDVGPDDVGQVRFSPALRGYRMDEVDTVLDRLAVELARRDEALADLERRLAEAQHPPRPGHDPGFTAHDTYGAQGAYGTQHSYGTQDPYGAQAPYSAQGPHGTHGAHGGNGARPGSGVPTGTEG